MVSAPIDSRNPSSMDSPPELSASAQLFLDELDKLFAARFDSFERKLDACFDVLGSAQIQNEHGLTSNILVAFLDIDHETAPTIDAAFDPADAHVTTTDSVALPVDAAASEYTSTAVFEEIEPEGSLPDEYLPRIQEREKLEEVEVDEKVHISTGSEVLQADVVPALDCSSLAQGGLSIPRPLRRAPLRRRRFSRPWHVPLLRRPRRRPPRPPRRAPPRPIRFHHPRRASPRRRGRPPRFLVRVRGRRPRLQARARPRTRSRQGAPRDCLRRRRLRLRMRVFLGESDPCGRRLTRLNGAPSSTGDRINDLGADCVVTTATTVLVHVVADDVFDSVGEPSFHLFHNDVSDAAYYVTSLAALTCGFGVHASFASSESLNVMPTRCSMQVRNNKSSSSLLHTSSAYTAGINVSSNTIGEQGIAASRPLTVSFVDVIGPVKHPPVYVLVVASKLVSAALDTEWVLEVPHKQLWPPPMQCELQGDTVQMVVCVAWIALDENEPEVRSFQFQQPWPPPAVLPRYFTAHLAHAYSVAGAVVLLCPTTIATHAVQRVFGKLISQCLLPFCPISAQVVVKAPWSPFILFEIKGDAVHLRPVPWPFFGAYYAAPVHLKTTLSSSGSVVQIFVWPILMHEISAATMEHFLVPAQHKGNLLNPDAVFHKLLSGLCGTKFLWMLQGECASCYAGDVQNELWLGDYISVFAFGGMSLWPSWVQGDNQHQPWPPPTEKRLTTCDAELRPVPWPLFHLIERCSCQSSRIWKPPWHVPVPQEISRLQTTDFGRSWQYKASVSAIPSLLVGLLQSFSNQIDFHSGLCSGLALPDTSLLFHWDAIGYWRHGCRHKSPLKFVVDQ